MIIADSCLAFLVLFSSLPWNSIFHAAIFKEDEATWIEAGAALGSAADFI
jgi:hypothetical protein